MSAVKLMWVTPDAIAKAFGVSTMTAYRAATKKAWAHV